MNTAIPVVNIRSLVGKTDIKPTVILIGAALIPAVHKAFGSMESWARMFGPSPGISPPLFMFGTACILMGVIPYVLIRTVFKESREEYGLRLGDWKFGALSVVILAPVIGLALLYPASQTGEIRAYYPFTHEAERSWSLFMILQGSRVVFFYTAWEFFYRGFLLFGLRHQFGAWPAICIQVVPQCLWHIGMPTGELMSSIAGGLLFGIMALRTGSILWPMLLHSFIGVCLDLFIVLSH